MGTGPSVLISEYANAATVGSSCARTPPAPCTHSLTHCCPPELPNSSTSSRLYPGKLQATGTAKADEHPTPYLASSFNKQVLSTRRTNPRAPFSTTSRVYRAPPTADQAGSTGDVPKSFKKSSKFSRSPSHVFPSDTTRAKFDKLWGREMPASPGTAADC